MRCSQHVYQVISVIAPPLSLSEMGVFRSNGENEIHLSSPPPGDLVRPTSPECVQVFLKLGLECLRYLQGVSKCFYPTVRKRLTRGKEE